MEITRSGIDTTKGPATGSRRRVHRRGRRPSRPCACPSQPRALHPWRAHAWHSHPLGQTIYVTDGVCLCQRRRADRPDRPGRPRLFERPTRSTGTARGPLASRRNSRSRGRRRAPRSPIGATPVTDGRIRRRAHRQRVRASYTSRRVATEGARARAYARRIARRSERSARSVRNSSRPVTSEIVDAGKPSGSQARARRHDCLVRSQWRKDRSRADGAWPASECTAGPAMTPAVCLGLGRRTSGSRPPRSAPRPPTSVYARRHRALGARARGQGNVGGARRAEPTRRSVSGPTPHHYRKLRRLSSTLV